MPHKVIIVGGGTVGLTTSIYLSLLGIENVLYERFAKTSIHPKALGLNQRTIEIFRAVGIEEDVKAQRAPKEIFTRTAWYTSLGPTGRTIVNRDAWNGGLEGEVADTASPTEYSILPQVRFEPLLHDRAKGLNPDGIINNSEVINVQEHNNGVKVTVKSRQDGSLATAEAQYVVVCDGGRSIGGLLGIKMEGTHKYLDMISAHFRAPLSQVHPDPRVLMSWFINPELGGSLGAGYLYHVGPYPLKPETEEWVFQAAVHPSDPKRFDDKAMLERITRTLKLENLEIKPLSIIHWDVNAIVAERYRTTGGRVFLAGDAAHRVPPWGALGVNTGIQDVPNLTWKLAYAIKADPDGKDGPKKYDALLNSYEAERRPVAQRVTNTSFSNLVTHSSSMDEALGIRIDNPVDRNLLEMETYFDSSLPGHAERRAAVDKVQRALDVEFFAPGDDIGFFYPVMDIDGEGARTRHGGQLKEDGKVDTFRYHPSTLPGHHLPHVWLEKVGKKVSTRDLVPFDRCLLIAQDASFWKKYESDLVTVEIVGGQDAWEDVDGRWHTLKGVTDTGAVITRPDGVVVLRKQSSDGVGNPEEFKKDLKTALKLH